MPRKRSTRIVARRLTPAVKAVIASAVGIAAVCGAIVAIEPAWTKVEPIIPASSGYVRGYVQSHTKDKLTPFEKWQEEQEEWKIAQSLSTERLNFTQQREYLIRAQKEQLTNKNSAIVREHIQQLEKDIEHTKRRIEEAEKASGRRDRK